MPDRYLDGAPMDELGIGSLPLHGRGRLGRAQRRRAPGRSQVSDLARLAVRRIAFAARRACAIAPAPDGQPIPVQASARSHDRDDARFGALPTPHGMSPIDRVALITADQPCCSGTDRAAHRPGISTTRLRAGGTARRRASSLCRTPKAAAPSHGENEEHQLAHDGRAPCCIRSSRPPLLEHGCERTHNDLLRQRAREERRRPRSGYGYAQHPARWWTSTRSSARSSTGSSSSCRRHAARRASRGGSRGSLSLGLLSIGPVSALPRGALAQIAAAIAGSGGTGRDPSENASLLEVDRIHRGARLDRSGHTEPAVWAGRPRTAGLHVHGYARRDRRGDRDGSRRHRRTLMPARAWTVRRCRAIR